MPGFQTKGIVEVSLEVFGGRVTEEGPTGLPEGVSPDEQDNTYIPGAVLTRPCLERQLNGAPRNTTITYEKSFVTPTGAIRNLYLFSNGQMFWEDPVNAKGALNLLFTGPAGSYAKSATMFGREFIGINDTLHGATVPIQWDAEVDYDSKNRGIRRNIEVKTGCHPCRKRGSTGIKKTSPLVRVESPVTVIRTAILPRMVRRSIALIDRCRV